MEVENASAFSSKKALATAKMDGKFKIKIHKDLEPGKQVLAYAYEDFAFHLYRKGHMKRHLNSLAHGEKGAEADFAINRKINQMLRAQQVPIAEELAEK